MRSFSLFFAGLLLLSASAGRRLVLHSHRQRCRAGKTAFDVPGIAVCVIKDGKVVHSKGYGFRSLNNRQPVDENTLFGIASNTKAFTTAALGILVDEGS